MAEQSGTHSPTDVTHHLKGIQFPATRDELVEQARRNGADPAVMRSVEGLPEGDYAPSPR